MRSFSAGRPWRGPRSSAALDAAARRRIPLLCAVAALWALILEHRHTTTDIDRTLFLDAGSAMLDGAGLAVFRDPILQVGPLYLVPLGVLAHLADLVHVPARLLVAMVAAVVATLLGLRIVRLLDAERRLGPASEVAACLVLLLAGPLALACGSGHFEELITGLLLMLAAAEAGRGRGRVAALVLVAAVGLKLWAVLGLPILLIRADLRRAAGRGLLAAAGIAACYVPLALDGAQTWRFTWRVLAYVPVSLVLPAGDAFPWTFRVAQAAVVCTAGALIARYGPAPERVVPVAIFLLRLMTDPCLYDYYWLPLAAAAALLLTRPGLPGVLALVVGTDVAITLSMSGALFVTPAVNLAVLATALVAVLACAAYSTRTRPFSRRTLPTRSRSTFA